jgi:hypothetical protein
MNEKQKEKIINNIEELLEDMRKSNLNGLCGHGINRCLKLKKEDIVIDITVSNDLDEEGYEDFLFEEMIEV